MTAAGQTTFLPADSESTRALDALQHGYSGGADVPVIVVFERRGGLTKGDLNEIGRLGEGLGRLGIVGATPVFDPISSRYGRPLGDIARIAHGVGPIAPDGEAALVGLAIDSNDRSAVVRGVGEIRSYLERHRYRGLRSYVTGPGGIAADLEHVVDDAGRTLLLATLGLVSVLLLLVYRAPLLALLPLLSVGAAYLIAVGIAYLLIEAGWIAVNSEGTMLLLVLVFGAGTDYSLLLVRRYREELERGSPPDAALPRALAESMPAIAASGGTVIAAMLVLLLADLESTHWLGPILAIGIAVMLAAAFTLLPAALSLLGTGAFWPARGFRAPDGSGPWRRVAGLVGRRARAIVVLVCAGLLVLSLGNLADHGTIGFGQGETQPTESSRGAEALERHFPPGLSSPLTVVTAERYFGPVLRRLQSLPPVKLASPGPPSSGFDDAVFAVILRGDPFSSEASEAVERIRDRLHEIDPDALVGGIPAENLDVEKTNSRDTKLIVPLVLLLVGLILIAVLRALVAPAYLIATVVGSFAATLGVVTFVFSELLGSGGIAFNLTLMAFIFLVALGVDYNIFLMTRVREEARALGTREGAQAALVDTGGVVTGAGLILAGAFATLTLLPLEELAQIGAAVSLGVLLDTFVVRALLVPSITFLLGERAWWPSR